MSDIRQRFFAKYNYPGSFFPESTTREIDLPTVKAAVAAAPDEEGYFCKDGWYSVRITSKVEKRFVATDGAEAWVNQGDIKTIGHWVVGERIHHSDIDATDANRILIRNIEGNSRDGGYGVLTRCGNWQIASDFDAVLSPAEVTA